MEFIVANVDNMKFDIEVALEEQYGALPLPFAGMDSKLVFNVLIHTT
jgi:cleavage and polyadenylation specificity factor subunit 4